MSISELKAKPSGAEPVQRFEVFTGAGRRRTWSAEEKARIVAESHVPGESACSVARRHALTPQQLFTWRREQSTLNVDLGEFHATARNLRPDVLWYYFGDRFYGRIL